MTFGFFGRRMRDESLRGSPQTPPPEDRLALVTRRKLWEFDRKRIAEGADGLLGLFPYRKNIIDPLQRLARQLTRVDCDENGRRHRNGKSGRACVALDRE